MEAALQTVAQRARHPALAHLDALVGTWLVEGRHSDTGEPVRGDVTFAWMFDGFYLVQHIALERGGRPITGVEYIGYDERGAWKRDDLGFVDDDTIRGRWEWPGGGYEVTMTRASG